MAFAGFYVMRYEPQKNTKNVVDRIYFSLTVHDSAAPDVPVSDVPAGLGEELPSKETKNVQYHITGKELADLPAAKAARRKAIKNIMRREVKKAHTKWMTEEVPNRRPKPQHMNQSEIDTELGTTNRRVASLTPE